ncbi:16S rRNA (uracil(1498)-N(3))-methyltransferase [soil metagenome]
MNEHPRFYCSTTLVPGMTISLPAPAVRHALVRRLQAGDAVTLFNGHGGEFVARINDLTRDTAIAYVEEAVDREVEPPYSVLLAQALTSSEKMDWTIEKAVELGATAIVPLTSERSVIRLSGDRAQRRHVHWSGIIQAACEQSGRNTMPSLSPLLGTREFIESHTGRLKLLASPRARAPLADVLRQNDAPPENRSVTLLIGPEGGFADVEEAFAIEHGFAPVSLGPRVLRTESAGPAALAIVHAIWG